MSTAAFRLSSTSRPGIPPNQANACRWQAIQVRTVWSNTSSAYWCRLYPSVITNTQALRARPLAGSTNGPAAPKSIWASSPGPVCTRTVTRAGCGCTRCTYRRTDE